MARESAESILFGHHVLRSDPEFSLTESDGGIVYLNFEKRDQEGKVEFWTSQPCPDFETAQQQQLLHRVDGPAATIDSPYAFTFHPPDQPAITVPALFGGLHMQLWFQHGQPHREDGPAELTTFDDGGVASAIYFRHGQRHREDGPAEIVNGLDGEAIITGWWLNGELHSETAPAWVEEENGELVCDYYLFGEEMNEQEWKRRVKAGTISRTSSLPA